MVDSDHPAYHLGELADKIGAELQGNADCKVTGLATLQDAQPSELSFLANPVYRKYLSGCRAAAVILHPDVAGEFSGNRLIHANPYRAFADLTSLFDRREALAAGIHPTAVIAESANISPQAAIGPFVVIEGGVEIGAGTEIGAGCFIGKDSVIGQRCRLASHIAIYHGVSVGDECIFHSGTVIGADGFGFAPDAGEWIKIHQLGGVVIGNRVEVGACSTIDRGALQNTVIADGVIIDNHVQIAHNVRIGMNTAIAGCVAIAGSATIGANCTIAGGVGIVGHINITDHVLVTARTLVTKSIDQSGSYSSGTPLSTTKDWRKNAVRFSQLDTIATRLQRLENSKSQ
jgi:UDP-3-O-[3-hydroxymyristoyl] glucosamine N-acyltransferase